ncbi:Uncharacterized protein ChrSV_5005 [Chromobacterium vaccinii]|nr:Uncharacterized protein ChrSW_4999 [Chromobacterium vaccinii]QND92460.1 Uncharacterized protein ChrSV_5005 [Chromobacterium vaccinii]
MPVSVSQLLRCEKYELNRVFSSLDQDIAGLHEPYSWGANRIFYLMGMARPAAIRVILCYGFPCP